MLRARIAVAVLAALAVLVPTAGPALAHAELESSSPTNGARLDAPPPQVRLEFGEDLLPETVRIVAADAARAPVPLPEPVVRANVATVDWPSDAPGGDYTVSFRVVSQDGHPVTGAVTFSYPTAGSAVPSAGSAAPAPSPTRSAVAASPSASPAPAPAAGGVPWGMVGALVVLVLAVVGVVAWTRRS